MYIDINLLPQDLRPRKPGIRLNFQSVVVIFALIAAGLMGKYYMQVDDTLKNFESQRVSLVQKQQMLVETIKLQGEVEALAVRVGERVNIIKELTSESDLRFDMLQHINSVLPENLWLLNITEATTDNKLNFNIEGMSYSKESISGFLEGLQKNDKFNNVALRSIRPSPMEVRDAFSYIVNIELASYKPPVVQEDPKAKSSSRKKKRTSK